MILPGSTSCASSRKRKIPQNGGESTKICSFIGKSLRRMRVELRSFYMFSFILNGLPLVFSSCVVLRNISNSEMWVDSRFLNFHFIAGYPYLAGQGTVSHPTPVRFDAKS
jgi:hypothetical protein